MSQLSVVPQVGEWKRAVSERQPLRDLIERLQMVEALYPDAEIDAQATIWHRKL